VLEPLISLSLSEDPLELLAASKYIRELVWCTSINYPRVQFQALWALANLAQEHPVEVDAKLVERAEEEYGVELEVGKNMGAVFRNLIVSTDHIMRTAEDDQADAIIKKIGNNLEAEEPETSGDSGADQLLRESHVVPFLSEVIGRESLKINDRSSDRRSRRRVSSHSILPSSAVTAGYRRRSTALSVRASIIQHGMADQISRNAVRRESLRLDVDDLAELVPQDRDSVSIRMSLLGGDLRISSSYTGRDEEGPNFGAGRLTTVDLSQVQELDDCPPSGVQDQQQEAKEDEDSDSAEVSDEASTEKVDESSLGGLRVIYAGFREMGPVVKLEALAVMVNLALSPMVAESLVFHQDGDTLEHLLELVWTPSLYSKFACLTIVNLATTENRRRVILRRGGLAAVSDFFRDLPFNR
jgi:hypothetical protein